MNEPLFTVRRDGNGNPRRDFADPFASAEDKGIRGEKRKGPTTLRPFAPAG